MDNIKLIKNIKKSFAADTCHSGYKWTQESPSTGHCAIAALIVQEELGGQIAKVKVGRGWHYFNLINNEILDVTKDQFNKPVNYTEYKTVNEKQLKKSVIERYSLLKERYLKNCAI